MAYERKKCLSPDSQNTAERLGDCAKSRFFFLAVEGEYAIFGNAFIQFFIMINSTLIIFV